MKEELKAEFQMLISLAESFGEDEEECAGNLQHAFNVLYNGEKQSENLFVPIQENNKYVVSIINCAADYAYDEILKKRVYAFYERAFDILVG